MRTNTNAVILAGLATVALMGCESTITGNEGNLLFEYTADDDIADFNKPVGIGAKLELRVLEVGTRREVQLTDARTDAPTILDVEAFASNRAILVGTGAGNALVEVTAVLPSGDTVEDSVNMSAAEPTVLEMRHSCTGDSVAHYFTNTDNILVGYDMESSNGRPVIGYGLFPIEVTPAEALALNTTSTDQANFHFDSGTMTGEVTIASTIDDTTINLTISAPEEVDGIEMNPASNTKLHVDETHFLHVWPTVGGSRVCQSEAPMTAESTTPDICTVSAVEPPSDEGSLDITGWVKVEGVAFGICTFTVTYTDSGTTAEFEAEIGEFPSSGE